jgi:hypothetical protein
MVHHDESSPFYAIFFIHQMNTVLIRMTKGCNDCSVVSSIAPGDSAQELCKTQNPDSRLYSKELILEIKNLNRRIVALELKEIRNSKSIVGRR